MYNLQSKTRTIGLNINAKKKPDTLLRIIPKYIKHLINKQYLYKTLRCN